jgi:hypothetical protein
MTTVKVLLQRRFYQRTLTMFILSVFATIIVANYFVNYQPLLLVNNEIVLWGTVVALMVGLFAQSTLYLMHGRRLVERHASRREMYGSIVFFASVLVAAAIALSTPQRTNGTLYKNVTLNVIGIIDLGILAMKIGPHAFITVRTFFKISSIESAAFFAAWILSYFRETSSLVTYLPIFLHIGDWIMTVPLNSVMRGALVVAATGGTVLGVRAILGREPGLVEAEVT